MPPLAATRQPRWPGTVSVLLWAGLAALAVVALNSPPPVLKPAAAPTPAMPKPQQMAAVAAIVLPPPPAPKAPQPQAAAEPKAPAPEPAAPAPAPQPTPVTVVVPLKAPEPEPVRQTASTVTVKPLTVTEAPKREPKPQPMAAPTAKPTLTLRPKAEPVVQPVPAPQMPAADPRETAAEGRVLLRLLEHGSGPRIEIAWPDRVADRERLFTLFSRCLGMRVAYLDKDGALYVEEGAQGAAWDLNVDRYSGFLRQTTGPATRAETAALARIARHHGGRPPGTPVHLFARVADALLLGGLKGLVGPAYDGAGSITARYDMVGGLAVTGVTVDGRAVPGRVDLSPLASAACLRGV